MAPYKLEDNIREKLETRELKPSSDAWKKLEAKLDAAQPKKKTVQWYYVAASFIGFIIMASIFYNQNKFEVSNQIVNESIEKNNPEKQSEIIPNNSKTEKIATEKIISEKVETIKPKGEEKPKPKRNTNTIKLIPQKKSVVDKKVESANAVAKTTKVEEEQTLKTTTQKEEHKLFNTKVNEVVASVKKLQESNTEITVTEVEALLDSARRDIQTQRILNSPKVDATALLQDVEWELEKSFRDKVFDALGDGFQKVRTAVTERND